MIRVFADQNMGDERLGRQPALDQPGRRGRLCHTVGTDTAGIFRTDGLDDPVLGGDDVDADAAILALGQRDLKLFESQLTFVLAQLLRFLAMQRLTKAIRERSGTLSSPAP
ncbi:hypothetical protein GCM10008966_15490 [Rhodovulum strictum]